MEEANLQQPSPGELQILRALWILGPSTVREVQREIQRSRPAGYTTVLKLLQIMTQKGLVRRDERSRAHVYEAAVSQQRTQRQIVADVLERVFEGSARQLVLRALEVDKTTWEQLQEIRKLLDAFEGGKSNES